MSGAAIETFLARLFSDAAFRGNFLADPARVAAEARLDETQIAAVLAMDRSDLELAAESYRRKREAR